MKSKKLTGILTLLISAFSLLAASLGIFWKSGTGEFEYQTIRNQTIKIYGNGLYKHMPSDVAIQGIAQDYITLFVGIPLLIISYFWFAKNSLKGKFLLAGVTGYFLVSYLFYMTMGMYNEMFLVYVILTGLTFYSFFILMTSFEFQSLKNYFSELIPFKFTGGFLIFNSIMIGLLWLGVVVPPILDGSIYPEELNHFTTLIVQGMDLSILLPASFIIGLLFIKKNNFGFLFAPVYYVFLSLLMLALTTKIIGMSLQGVDAGPALIIIPLFTLTAIINSILILKNVKDEKKMKIQ